MSQELTRAAISQLVGGGVLSGPSTAAVAAEIMSGGATESQIAAFITALRLRGETVDQIVAFAQVMRAKATPIAAPSGPLLDTVGTGGDGAGTFNISTTACFIAAGAGATVAKHGNRGVTSACGSADVLRALGVRIDAPVAVMQRCLQEVGIAFLFAPSYHSAMKYAIGPRRDIGIRTIFNLLGPLSNPAGATHQMIGVYDAALTEVFCQVLRDLGSRRALVVHGADGMDEITTTAVTQVSELHDDGRLSTWTLDPAAYGIGLAQNSDLAGQDPEANAAILRSILEGAQGPRTDIALLNAAASIYVVGLAEDLAGGLARAREAIQSGAALEKLRRLCEVSNA